MPARKNTIQGLTDQMIRFCDHYLITFNATKASIAAGYSKHTAVKQGSRLLAKSLVQKYLAEQNEKIGKKLDITKERVMAEIGRIAFSNTKKFFDEEGNLKKITDLDDEDAAILAGLDIIENFEWFQGTKIHTGNTKKIKLWDKTKALEMLAKHFKIYSDAPITNLTKRQVIKIGGKEIEF